MSIDEETGTGNDQAPAGSLPLATLLQSGAALALRHGGRALRGDGRARIAGRRIRSDGALAATAGPSRQPAGYSRMVTV